MTQWHGYFAIEDLSLTSGQRATLWDELQALGISNDDPQPAKRNHWRFRLIGRPAGIFEAQFNADNLTIPKFKTRLAALFGVSVDDITVNTIKQTYDTEATDIATFKHLGDKKVRFAAFAGVGSTWAQSKTEAKAFVDDNSTAWEPTE